MKQSKMTQEEALAILKKMKLNEQLDRLTQQQKQLEHEIRILEHQEEQDVKQEVRNIILANAEAILEEADQRISSDTNPATGKAWGSTKLFMAQYKMLLQISFN